MKRKCRKLKSKIIKKALKKILPKGTPIMEVSDNEYKKDLEEYVVKVTNEDGSEIIVPNDISKELARAMFNNDKKKEFEHRMKEVMNNGK